MARTAARRVSADTGKALDDAMAQNFLSRRDALRWPSWVLCRLSDALASPFAARRQGRHTAEASELTILGRIVL